MKEHTDKISQITKILTSSWSTSGLVEDRVKITAVDGLDSVEISIHEIDFLAKLLQSDDKKIRFEVIKLLGLFGDHATMLVKSTTKDFFDYSEAQQEEIIASLSLISSEQVLQEFSTVISRANKPFSTLYKLIFHCSELFETYPLPGLELLFEAAKFETAFEIYKKAISEGLIPLSEEEARKEFEKNIHRIPPVGMSQEQEKRKAEFEITNLHIQKAITEAKKLENCDKRKKRNRARKILRQLQKVVE